ncbi:MAG: hypothetical protein JWL71_1244 [Acidobacteria bacterium]|nr:hypothetical protein [Acidobacteriota bacterium]
MATRNQPQAAVEADASPTKDFFISMLVKDIELTRSILDLVDNSVDGARRLRGKKSFKGLRVSITATPGGFEIQDNCGGIDRELAEHYALRFGRPTGMITVKHSVGQFGVGMKRALFKLGTHFTVESTTSAGSFRVDVDVSKWRQTDGWTFSLEPTAAKLVAPVGTRITVEPLHPSVAEDFGLETFRSRLKRELEAAHAGSLLNGLSISLNDDTLQAQQPTLLQSKTIKPACRVSEHAKVAEKGKPAEKKVEVRMYVGVGKASDPKSDPREAGWYVYCNGRLVLGHDQTQATGWGTGSIPKYHNQYSQFRGFVFFDCDDASRLPWNTTKTGVDAESAIYRTVQREMVTVARPVINFLNDVDRETKAEPSAAPLTKALKRAKLVTLAKIRPRELFVSPRPKSVVKNVAKISYERPSEQVERAKKHLKVASLREVGERTFDYYYRFEIKGQ